MKEIFYCLVFLAVINCLRAEITVSEFIISTNTALHVHDNKVGAKLNVSGKNVTIIGSTPEKINAIQEAINNNNTNASHPLEEASVETTTAAPVEELILVFPESEPQVPKPNGLRPDTSVDTGLSYFLDSDFPGENFESEYILY